MRPISFALAALLATATATPARAGFDDHTIITESELQTLSHQRSGSETKRVGSLEVRSIEPERDEGGSWRVKTTRADGLKMHVVVRTTMGRSTPTHVYLFDGHGGYLHAYPDWDHGVRATKRPDGGLTPRMVPLPKSRLR